MPGIRDTAYPQLKSPSEKELDQLYTPELAELVWAEKRTREDTPRVGLLVLLKTFQRLGYFVPLSEVPDPILQHVARHAEGANTPSDLNRYDTSSFAAAICCSFAITWASSLGARGTGRDAGSQQSGCAHIGGPCGHHQFHPGGTGPATV